MKFLFLWTLLWAAWFPAHALDLQPVPVRPAPALSVALVTGGQANLAKLRGRVALVNFWATWCPPCLMEMPSMNRLALRMAKKPFVLLAVNGGEPAEWVRAFAMKTRPAFSIGLDPGAAQMHAWGALVMPTSFLVDKAGRIRYSLVGPKDWDSPEMVSMITQLLAE